MNTPAYLRKNSSRAQNTYVRPLSQTPHAQPEAPEAEGPQNSMLRSIVIHVLAGVGLGHIIVGVGHLVVGVSKSVL